MTYQTMTDVAFNYLTKRKKGTEFIKIWEEVQKTMAIPENQIGRKRAQFYSELMLDNRFASLKENKWDLRNRHTFDEVHVDTDAIILDDEELIDDISAEDLDEDAPKNEEDF